MHVPALKKQFPLTTHLVAAELHQVLQGQNLSLSPRKVIPVCQLCSAILGSFLFRCHNSGRWLCCKRQSLAVYWTADCVVCLREDITRIECYDIWATSQWERLLPGH